MERRKMVKVQCIKCNREGSLTIKQTKSKGITYQYWYVEHHIGKKIKWCYLGKYEKLPEEYKRLIHKDTQTNTQTSTSSKNLNSRLYTENNQQTLRAGSLARLGHLLDVQKVAGSNPARPTTFYTHNNSLVQIPPDAPLYIHTHQRAESEGARMHDGSIEEKSIPQHQIHKVRKRLKMSECIHANSRTQKSLNSQYVN